MQNRIIPHLRRYAASIRQTPGLRFLKSFHGFAKTLSRNDVPENIRTLKGLINKVSIVLFLLPDYFRIRKSPLFDSAFLLETCPEAQYSRLPLALYYLKSADPRKNPSPAFNAAQYLLDYPDVAESGVNPLVHYLRYGKKEERKVSPVRIQKKLSVKAPTETQWDLCAEEYRKSAPASLGTRPVTVVVPVYRGFDETLNCLFSLVKSRIHAEIPCRLMVIDDQGPDPDLSQALVRLADRGLIELIRNKENLGFVASVNIGMMQYPETDVILLNADTEVYGNWVERLHRAVYSANQIGTATPFSNNATICSYPLFCEDYPYSYGLEFSELDRIIQGANPGKVINVPTGVGFCMYIRRDCLNATGLFDEKTFGRGYGEENDFCQRAWKQGWRSVLCGDTFVRHLGSVSFAGERSARVLAAMEHLRRLHPTYEADVSTFIQKDPVRPLRERIDMGIVRHFGGTRKMMLHICIAWGGGTAQHVSELCAALNAQGCTAVKAFPDTCRTRLKIRLEALSWPGNMRDMDLSQPPEAIGRALREMGFDHLHVHHTVGFETSFPDTFAQAAAAANLPYDFTVHDYYCVCPRINMLDDTDVFCDCHDPDRCDACLKKLGSADVPVRSIDAWRRMYGRFLASARMVFVPDQDVATRLKAYYPDIQFTVRKHIERHLPEQVAVKPRKDRQMLRVAVIGQIEKPKGSEVLKACAREAAQKNRSLRFVVMGTSMLDEKFKSLSHIELKGTYQLSRMTEELKKAACHLVFFPAVWPETYSYTLSQALSAGLYPVCFDLGAPARRIKELGWGSVLPREMWSDPQGINTFLLSCPVVPAPPTIKAFIGGRYPDMLADYYQL